ncbi:hypothetical protein DH2020_034247 [Rehmannia glutinosa]|uniref:Protein kinase domain-containing protein n=1 Tax=Rehmannia glutinosa TaxID=99300 RepID=A0ABR0VAF4_REHGL
MANSITYLSLLIILCYLSLSTPVTFSSDNQTDLLTLLHMKAAIINVDSLDSWNQTTHFCSWEGIRCGHRHPNRVVAINLQSHGLVGSLSPHIGQLSLRSCGLSGEIPESLIQLDRLIYIQLGENNLIGTIPPGLFNISTIVRFGVANNELEGSIPSTLGLTLPNLKILILGGNQISGRVPVSLSNASSMEQLVMSNNSFTGPLPRFGGLSRLRFLGVAQMSIEDDINFVSSLINCTNLQILEAGYNLLHGQIPNTMANLSIHLYALQISTTQVYGKIPRDIGNLVGLTDLDLSNNNLEGHIPDGIGKLSNLHRLSLGGNRFTNQLPSSFGNLSLLIELDLGRNNFSGVVPQSLRNCTNLLNLNLSRNNLNGPIPREIMYLSSISIFLDLSFNAFTGSVPFEVGSLINLAYLDLSNNMLSGLIPNSISSCRSMEQLYLNGNLFQGQIPEGLSYLMGLQDLDLSQNNLSGLIPNFLSELHLLQLNLSFNRLQGEVPKLGVFGNKSAISLQGNNELCGGISELNFPSCPLPKSSKKNLSTALKILIPIASVVAFLCLFIFLYKRKKPNNNLSSLPSFFEILFFRLSYADLIKATEGFSETNLLGVGRFGSVYKGILDDGHCTLVAVKVLNLIVKGASRSFTAECNALKGIRHRNLVKVLSVCESIDFQGNDFKALIYEFKANGSLEKWLYHNNEQDISNTQVQNPNMIQRLNIAIDIAQAIAYLHCGTDSVIVHGDLKPSNILLDHDMTACVGDFGLAKIISNMLPPQESASSEYNWD